MKKKKQKPVRGWGVIMANGQLFPAMWEKRNEVEQKEEAEQVVRVEIKVIV